MTFSCYFCAKQDIMSSHFDSKKGEPKLFIERIDAFNGTPFC